MNKKDHFDELFTSRLRDQEPEMESWNMPSESVWENAKVHFPKQKKKRRFFIFLFPAIGLMALLYFLSYKQSLNAPQKMEVSQISNLKDVDDILENNPKSTKENHSITASSLTSESSNSTINNTIQTKSNSESTLNANHPALKSKNAAAFSDLNTAHSNSHTDNPIATLHSDSGIKTNSKNAENLTNNITDLLLQEKGQFTSAQTKSIQIGKDSRTSEEKAPLTLKEPRAVVEKNIVSKLPISFFETNINNPAFPSPKLIKVKKQVSPYRWAAGLSTSRFLQNPFIDFDDPTENTISTNFSIANLSLALQIGKRFSFTSGIRILNATINVESVFEEAYDANQPSESIASNIAESSQVGALSINDNESAIMIKFLSDIDLTNGDPLTIDSKIPLKLKAYSIPFIFKKQFPINRFTPYLMGGISIDFFEIKLDEIFLEIRHKNQIIHEPVTFQPIKEYETIGSTYLGLGTQYNFSDRWYGEVGITTDLFDLKFTTIEAGINYRF